MKRNTLILFIGIGWLACACSEQEVSLHQEEAGPIALSATVYSESQATGSRVNTGAVSSGTYYLTFTNRSGTPQTVSATFASDEIGYPYVYTNNVGTPLNWKDVQGSAGSSSTFTLDNVPNETSTQIVTLNESYKASVYNNESTNDIVWGSLTETYNKTPLHFNLDHRMASIRVNIDVDGNDTEVEDLLEEGVTVSLLNIKTTPSTFNRTYGIVNVNHEVIDKSFQMHEGVLLEGGYTNTCIFPPQTFSDSYRPRLQIKLNDGTTYTGSLPQTMFTGTSDNATAATLEFYRGRCLTINVLLVGSISGREILFLPAVVEDWVDVGSVGIIARQLGIYDEENYKKAVEAYNKEPKDETALSRFGTKDAEGKWTIHIFASFGESSDAFTKFANDTYLSLNLHGHTVYGTTNENDLIELSTENPSTGDNGDENSAEDETTSTNEEEES